MLTTVMPSKPSEQAKSILLQKCPVFPANATFIFMLSRMMTLKWPVEEAKMSIPACREGIDARCSSHQIPGLHFFVVQIKELVMNQSCQRSHEETKMSISDMIRQSGSIGQQVLDLVRNFFNFRWPCPADVLTTCGNEKGIPHRFCKLRPITRS